MCYLFYGTALGGGNIRGGSNGANGIVIIAFTVS
jgi:hypothetical protein